jgi:hypothetical protein
MLDEVGRHLELRSLLAARLPSACTGRGVPSAESRMSTGARAASVACSAVSTQPMATPAARKGRARAMRFGPVRANPT